MSVKLVGQWTEAAKRMALMAAKTVAISGALGTEALMHEKDIKLGITFQNPGGKRFRRISFFTRTARKAQKFSGTKALIVRGDLRAAVKTTGPIGATDWFVGIKKTATSSDGTKLVDVALINEFGHKKPIIINVDQKGKNGKSPRDYFMALFLKGLTKAPLKASTTILVIRRIPQRPFIRPVQEKHKPGQDKRIMDNIFRNMGLQV